MSYQNDIERLTDINIQKVLNDSIEEIIYKLTGLNVSSKIYQESLVENPFERNFIIEINNNGKSFITKINIEDIPDGYKIHYFINKIKEQHPQLFI